MSWQEFEDMLTQTVLVYSKTGTDVHGSPTHTTTPKRIKARVQVVEGRAQRTFTVDKEEVMAKYKLILGTTTTINKQDKITLPDGYEPTTMMLLGVYPVDDESGRSHYEIWV